MASFGETLRRERELHGVTLAELSAATRISLRYIEALETNEFQRLPGGVFNRGYVRAIARYLELDEREWLAAFLHAANEEPEILALYAPEPPREPKPARQSWTSFALLVVLFGAGVFAVHSVRTRRAAEAVTAPALPVLAPTSPIAATNPSPSATPVVPAAEASSERPAPTSSPKPPRTTTNGGDLRLQVAAIEDAWVSIAADGQTLFEGMMKSRETRVFRAAGELDLRTGNASALVLTLNGETLPPLGNPGEVKRITLTQKDLPRPSP